MGKNYKSAEAYVMQELQQAHETIEEQKHHIETLETDLHDFNATIVGIKKQFEVVLTTDKDDRYIRFYKDAKEDKSSVYISSDIIVWESSNKEFFDYFVKLLGLEVPEIPEKEEMVVVDEGGDK